MTFRRSMVPWQLMVVTVLCGTAIAAFAWFGDTGAWSDAARTDGEVLRLQDRAAKDSGSAWVGYDVGGAHYERWLPDVAEIGTLRLGDAYPLEFKLADPLDARGVAANADDARLQRLALPVAPFAVGVSALVILLFALWREGPATPLPPSSARRAKP